MQNRRDIMQNKSPTLPTTKPNQNCRKHWTKLSEKGHVYAVLQRFQARSSNQTTMQMQQMNAN